MLFSLSHSSLEFLAAIPCCYVCGGVHSLQPFTCKPTRLQNTPILLFKSLKHIARDHLHSKGDPSASTAVVESSAETESLHLTTQDFLGNPNSRIRTSERGKQLLNCEMFCLCWTTICRRHLEGRLHHPWGA